LLLTTNAIPYFSFLENDYSVNKYTYLIKIFASTDYGQVKE